MLKRIFVTGLSVSCFIVVFQSCEHKPKELVSPVPDGKVDTSDKCSPDTVYFVNEILPLINSNCAQAGCHDASSRQDGVQLDNYAAIISTGKIKPGNPGGSDFYEVLNETDPDKQMPPPPKSRLTPDQIAKIRKWIEQGARNNYCRSGCDTTAFTYSGAVTRIISTNCVACHSSGNILLNTYAGVKARVDDGKLWGAINHLSGFQPMPNAGTFISECDRKIIKKWIDNGAPNN